MIVRPSTTGEGAMSSQSVLYAERQSVAAGELPFGEAFFRRLFDNLYDGVYFVDVHRRILFWNHGAERLSGFRADEVLGSYCHADILGHADEDGCSLCQSSCPLVYTIENAAPASKRVFLRHKDGRRIAVDVHVMPLRNDRDEIIGGVEIFRDASSAIALETAYNGLRELVEKDPLTGVANRRHLDRIIDAQLDVLNRTGIPFCLILIDVDHFKEINDTWGHGVGDKALIAFAEALQRASRRTDLVGRWGGDEFLVVLPELRAKDALMLAERQRAAVAAAAPEEMDRRGLTGSLGVAEAVLGDAPMSLLDRVDSALYRSKSQGRNRVESVDTPPCNRQTLPCDDRRRRL
jgi:diguanylate cyclase (GGDEF)-like protein/PAS domain S-box-containing protein